ncbi:uncharacterized protein LOC128953402 [Oppia nitens]|uniref:uncharacterized protein LOC128953402 n=1 Tax=Oppia nitens TaxID=1686743 RepID=UPI0023DB57DF|nr:uncharacterized protein LOC128953402 [Oppia nitens]
MANPWTKPPVILYKQFKLLNDTVLTIKINQTIQAKLKFLLGYCKRLKQSTNLDYLSKVYVKLANYLQSSEQTALISIVDDNNEFVDNSTEKHLSLVQLQNYLDYWFRYVYLYGTNDCPLEAYKNISSVGNASQLVRQLMVVRGKLFTKLQQLIDSEKLDKDREFWAPIQTKILNYYKNSSKLIDEAINKLVPNLLKIKTLQFLVIDTEFLMRGYSNYKEN